MSYTIQIVSIDRIDVTFRLGKTTSIKLTWTMNADADCDDGRYIDQSYWDVTFDTRDAATIAKFFETDFRKIDFSHFRPTGSLDDMADNAYEEIKHRIDGAINPEPIIADSIWARGF